jgi:hypothetical protein
MEEAKEGVDQLPDYLRRQITDRIILKMAQVGVVPTASERADLVSNDPRRVTLGLAGLRVRLNRGQFAIRQVIMESGLTEKQRKVLSVYRQIRPDVEIKSLPVSTVYVRAAAQTYHSQATNSDETLQGPAIIGRSTVEPSLANVATRAPATSSSNTQPQGPSWQSQHDWAASSYLSPSKPMSMWRSQTSKVESGVTSKLAGRQRAARM